MTTFLDAFALIALGLDERAAGEVQELLRRGDVAVVAVNLAEAADVLARVHRRTPTEVRDEISTLIGEVLSVVSVDEEIGWRAAELRSRHYRPRTSELSLADCVLLACARSGDEIATADPALARAARAEGIGIVALPDDRGRRP